jgi:hypothetical protein
MSNRCLIKAWFHAKLSMLSLANLKNEKNDHKKNLQFNFAEDNLFLSFFVEIILDLSVRLQSGRTSWSSLAWDMHKKLSFVFMAEVN